MKYLAQFLVASVLVLPAFARAGGGGHVSSGGRAGGFHGAVAGGYRGGYSVYGGYGGYRGNFRNNPGFAYHRYHYGYGYGSGYWPWLYAYPFFDYGDAYDSGYDTGYTYPSYDYGSAPPVVIYQQQPPPQYYAPPPEPVQPEAPPPDTSTAAIVRPADGEPVYLIALKGQSNIQAAITYWVEGDTLQYLNLQRQQKHVPLDSIDRTVSSQLNHDRHMDLILPATP